MRINENRWFDIYQPMLLGMANTDFGKDLLCIRKFPYPIVSIRKNEVRYLLQYDGEKATLMSDFRVGAKWAKVIRHRWDAFNSYARYFQYGQNYSLPMSNTTKLQLSMSCATLQFFPDPHPETTTVDGYVYRNSAGENFSSLRGGTGVGFDDTSTDPGPQGYMATIASSYQQMNRGFALFDTSSLTASANISSATAGFNGRDAQSGITGQSCVFNRSAPASNTGLAASDFNIANWPGVELGTARIATGSWAIGSYNIFTFSSTSEVSKTGITKTSLRLSGDFDNSEPTFAGNKSANADAKGAEATGTASDPYIEVIYTLLVPSSTFLTLGVG